MTKKLHLIILLTLTIGFTNLHAGWYECYSFTGTIGKYPITLSFQMTPEYFGEGAKKEYNVIGVYKYDKYNTPIRLEGIMNLESKQVRLFETINNKQTAIFKIDLSSTQINGTWTVITSQKQLNVHLEKVATLNDKESVNSFENIEIMQEFSLSDYYFVGKYSKEPMDDRAQMDKLKIIKKDGNETFQVIDFASIESPTGNVATVIYTNVEITDHNSKQLMVWVNIGRMGGYLPIRFDPDQDRFVMDNEPILDGPN